MCGHSIDQTRPSSVEQAETSSTRMCNKRRGGDRAYIEDDGVEERGEVEGGQGVGPVLVLAQEERLMKGNVG